MDCCRSCGYPLQHIFADLGAMPPANSYVVDDSCSETIFPLRVRVCDNCFLVQTEIFELPENIFSNYAYFSSISQTWLDHCKQYVDCVTAHHGLSSSSFVVEIASNDGYLLKNFLRQDISVLGVEPAQNIAAQANSDGVDTICDFFSARTAVEIAARYGKADLLIGNNVFAHVPDINDFVSGLKTMLAPKGLITLEFPDVLSMISKNEFDTIYHEHFYYFSLTAVMPIFERHDLSVFHVEKLKTHGGSYRLFICNNEDETKTPSDSIEATLEKEEVAGLKTLHPYVTFENKARKIKRDTLSYLIQKKERGEKIVAFGAPAKGATFLNYCGVGRDFIDYIIDETPYKQGLYMPGMRIPILPIERLKQDNPDCIVILPWNWTDEILAKLKNFCSCGTSVATFIPDIMEYSL